MRATYKFTGLSDVDVQIASLRHELDSMERRVESTVIWRLDNLFFRDQIDNPSEGKEEGAGT